MRNWIKPVSRMPFSGESTGIIIPRRKKNPMRLRNSLPDKIGQGCGSGFSDFVDPEPEWESGSRGKKMKKFQWKNALFSYFLTKNLPLKFEKKIVFASSVLAWIRNWIRIRIEQKCWIRILIKSIRIHNPEIG
jgi:hypothetical protein